jgi:thiamine-phosphate pyrophosphorylase
VTDRRQTAGRDLLDVLAQALEAGVRAIQLREKDLAAEEVLRIGKRLLPLCRAAGAALIINDRVDVALALGADGVQLTRRSVSPKLARGMAGAGMILGISCHSLGDVQEAVEGGVDFLVFGPVFTTPSKASYGPPLGTDLLRQAKALCDLPVFAIGGIVPELVPEVLDAGADGVAAISAVLASPDPFAATKAFLHRWGF